MVTHTSDASGERNVEAEGNAIKQAIVASSNGQTDKKFTYSFSSLTKDSIPGFTLYKVLNENYLIEYIPDFNTAIQTMQEEFKLIRESREFRSVKEITMTSYTLHLSYQMFYYYLVVTQNVNSNADYQQLINAFRQAGFNKLYFPRNLSDWLNGLGKFKDDISNDVYAPKMPNFTANDTGFATADTKHLLPNFKAMLSMIHYYNPSTGTARNMRNFTSFQNAANTDNLANTIPLAVKRGLRRLGYFENLSSDVNEWNVLPANVNNALNTAHEDPILGYLRFDQNLIANLHRRMQIYYSYVDHIVIDNIPTSGSDLCLSPLRVIQYNDSATNELIAAVGDNNVTSAIASSEIISKYEIVNGNIYIAAQTPLITLSDRDIYTAENINPFNAVPFSIRTYTSMAFTANMFYRSKVTN